MQKAQSTIPVYNIQSVEQVNGFKEDLVIDHFEPYQQRHLHLHTPHRHLFYHILLFTKGSGTHTIDFEQFDVRKGQIYFMIPGQVHNWNFKGPVSGYVVNFSDHLFRSFLADQMYLQKFSFLRGVAKDSVVKLKPAAFDTAKNIFETLIKEVYSNEPYNRDMICTKLLSLFILTGRCCAQGNSKQIPTQNQLLLYNFRKLVDDYYAEKRLPKDYAAMLYITPNHLNALCHDLLGISAGELIRDRVLLEAKRLLVNATLSISEIAYQLNFTDNSYFTKFFKKYSGITPEEFRKLSFKDAENNE
jgi:AraC-like DNA-binding protein